MLVLRNLSFSLNHILFLKPSFLSRLRRLVHHFTNNFMCTSTLVLINTSYIRRITYKYRFSLSFDRIHFFALLCLCVCMPKFTFFLLFSPHYKCLHFSYLISDIQLLFFKFFRIKEQQNGCGWLEICKFRTLSLGLQLFQCIAHNL